ncbi:proprotein convertase subtilisin/kexin type 5-like [Mercenaria mercenaria]|uniref:proprotein convertase subtilisin/kexin type 5-like n=1 Tax=Mercenaria mercenaria TaxID=6596 RepID=UPI00234F4D46|nr:proprotein convertase subtilisin/kexin type 5-like [Mercenaria mercenaria]
MTMKRSQLQNKRVQCNQCQDGQKCPDHLPYCTPVGCVLQCPDGAFTNGSNCVQDCADQYIFNSTCVPNCPASSGLIEEQINFKFKKLRFCRSQCGEHTFAYNNTCIRSCPHDSKFVENGQCASNCSSLKTLHRNISDDNRLVGIECRETCNKSSKNPFQSTNECVSKCNEGQFVVDGKCLKECPTDKHVLISLEVCIQMGKCLRVWPEQKYCSERCPDSYFIYNTSCVHRCPETSMYALDGHCVKNCPMDKRYTCYKPESLYLTEESVKGCCEECPHPLVANNFTCVDVCPLGMKEFERTCLWVCPNDTHVEYVTEIGSFRCVTGCKKYIMNNLCTDSCPNDAKYIYESHCAAECPNSYPYRVENSFTCLKECPKNFKKNILTNECVEICPAETSVHEMTCVSECPKGFKQINSRTSEVNCVKSCDKYELNGTCVDSCQSYSVNKTCVEKCPRNYSFRYRESCFAICPANTCLMDDGFNCTDDCMNDIGNNKLVYTCPKSTPYIQKYMSERRCVSACERNEVLNDFTCINVTDCKRAVLSHGKCEHECPEGYLYMPKNRKEYALSVGDYQYKVEDAQENPCVTATEAYLSVVFIGIVVVMYATGVAIFLSNIQIGVNICGRKKEQESTTEEVFDHRCGERSNASSNCVQDVPAANEHSEDRWQDDEPLLTLTENNAQSAGNGDVPMLDLAANTIQDSSNIEEYCMVDIHVAGNHGEMNEENEDVPLLSASL